MCKTFQFHSEAFSADFMRPAPNTSISNAAQLWNLIPEPLCGTVEVILAAIIYTFRPVLLDKEEDLPVIVSSYKLSWDSTC